MESKPTPHIITRPIPLPSYALAALELLDKAGYESWVVGGYVRDAVMGRSGNDIDIATEARWQEVARLFEEAGWRVHETGTAHGTVTVAHGANAIEITTYRSDGAYAADARHPKAVSFVRTIEEDVARRDFTVNALAYRPDRGILDCFGGLADLEKGTLRAVGEADRRFSEDALRMLRACRFASELGFALEEDTYKAMVRNKGLIGRLPAERVRVELERLLCGKNAGHALIEYADVLEAALPELTAMKGFAQHTPYHIYNVLEHTAHVVDAVRPTPRLRWAALLHDIGKPAAFFRDETGRGHFYGHPTISEALAQGTLMRLRLPTAEREAILALVRHHDETIPATTRGAKRLLQRLGGDPELFRDLCELKRGDALGQAPRYAGGRIAAADALEQKLEEILAAGEAFSLQQLAISGTDMKELGVAEGPAIGEMLTRALDAVIEERVANEREALLNYVRASL